MNIQLMLETSYTGFINIFCRIYNIALKVKYTPGKKFLQKIFKLIFDSVRHWVASWKVVNMMCLYLVACLAKMSEIDHIVLEQYRWNQQNFGHSKSQLFVTG